MDENEIRAAIGRLCAGPWSRRREARETLVEAGGEATGPLVDALEHADALQAAAVRDAIAEIGEPAVRPLADAYRSLIEERRELGTALRAGGRDASEVQQEIIGLAEHAHRILDALADTGDRAVGLISDWLVGDDPNLKSAASRVLGRIGPRAVPHLMKILRSPEPPERLEAVHAAAAAGTGGIRVIEAALEDSAPLVRQAAVAALEPLPLDLAFGPMIRALALDAPESERVLARLAERDRPGLQRCLDAVGGDPLGLPDVLRDPGRERGERILAALGLSAVEAGVPDATEALLETAAGDDPVLAAGALYALGGVEDEAVRRTLLEMAVDAGGRSAADDGEDGADGSDGEADETGDEASDPDDTTPIRPGSSASDPRLAIRRRAAVHALADPATGRRRVPPPEEAVRIFRDLAADEDAELEVREIALEALAAAMPGEDLLAFARGEVDGGGTLLRAALDLVRDPSAVEALVDILKEGGPTERQRAAVALGRVGAGPATDELIETLEDRREEIREAATGALVRAGTEAVPRLLTGLKQGSPSTRRLCALAVGEIGDVRAIPLLVEALRDPSPAVRTEVARALGKIQHPDAVEALEEAIEDPDSLRVRVAAAEALLLQGEHQGAAPLTMSMAAMARWHEETQGKPPGTSAIFAWKDLTPSLRESSRELVSTAIESILPNPRPALEIVWAARDLALRHHLPSLHTGHVICAIRDRDPGYAGRLLEPLGSADDAEDVLWKTTHRLATPVRTTIPRARLPLAPRTELTLLAAEDRARALSHPRLGPLHLLLGLLQIRECAAARALVALGTPVRDLEVEVAEILEKIPGRTEESDEASAPEP